ncbi:MAG: YCF48-related protein [Reichenbachiella sp.]
MMQYIMILTCLVFSSFSTLSQAYVIDSLVSFRGLSVLNEKVVWVSGSNGTVAKTIDGGNTWDRLKVQGGDSLDFRDIEVFSELEAIVMSAGEGSKSNIYRTENGGSTWKLVYANTFEKGFFNGISFKNKNEGVLTGDPVENKLFVLHTKDGGANWNRVDTAILPEMKVGEFGGYAASGSHLIYNNDYFINCTGGEYSRIIISDSSLETWEVVSTAIAQGGGSSGIFSIDFCNSNYGVAVGGDYTKENEGLDNVMITNDGGLTWTLSTTFSVYQSAVKFVDCKTVVSTGPKGTYLSRDGGEDWEKTLYEGYHTMGIAEDGSIWAAGSKGRVTKIEIKSEE